ncbi:MAG TPA: phosphotransferase [Ignavibacteria bacterium]|jgi:aminoglycoside/choline kinase family phosphotransferase
MMQQVQLGRTLYTQVQHLFNRHFGLKAENIEPLTSHGSDRIILRLTSSGGKSAIGIINYHIEENRAFIAFAEHFRKFGLNIPEIYNTSEDYISYLLEDLGDITLLKKINGSFGEEEINLYKRVIEILPEFQIKAGKSADFSWCYQFNEFAEENIRHDINYFCNRFLKVIHNISIDENELNKDFQNLTLKLLEPGRGYFLYRDFQSRNIMLKNGKFYFIDFQSGRRGPLLYDIASLLYDAKANIPQQSREELAEHYLNTVKDYVRLDSAKYKDYFWYFAIIRILQAMGAYGFLGIVKRKSRFLESIPLAIKNMRFILENRVNKNEFPYLRKIFIEIQYEKT